jgi:putative endonuclease
MKYYIYILNSEKDKNYYVGFTNNLNRRIQEHTDGNVASTKNRRPLKLIYWEGCLNQKDATNREKYLKSSWGKRYIKNRLKHYLTA